MRKRVWELVWPVVVAAIAFLITGCDTLETDSFTGQLWSDWSKEHYQPAPRADVKMFQQNGDEVLVQYNEQREKTGEIRRREYLLLVNAGRVQEMKKPRFSGVKSASGLIEIPVEQSGHINLTAPLWAELTPEADGFRLFRNGVPTDWYHLPVYRDKINDTARFFLTPLTLTADAAVAGAVIGVVGGFFYLEARCGN